MITAPAAAIATAAAAAAARVAVTSTARVAVTAAATAAAAAVILAYTRHQGTGHRPTACGPHRQGTAHKS